MAGFKKVNMMASQKLTNCCVAAIALAASTYVSTPHCSTIARLAFGAFCLAIYYFAFLRKHQTSSKGFVPFIDLAPMVVVGPDEAGTDLFIEPVRSEVRLLSQNEIGSPMLALPEELLEGCQQPRCELLPAKSWGDHKEDQLSLGKLQGGAPGPQNTRNPTSEPSEKRRGKQLDIRSQQQPGDDRRGKPPGCAGIEGAEDKSGEAAGGVVRS